MKPESNIKTSTPAGILNPEKNVALTSVLPLPISLIGSLLMNFTIAGEDYVFTLTVNGDGQLQGFTATKEGNTTYDCSIQLVSQTSPERACCSPAGCTAGSC
jgi:hypothetical protein